MKNTLWTISLPKKLYPENPFKL